MITNAISRFRNALRNSHVLVLGSAIALAVATGFLAVPPAAAQSSSVSYAYSANNQSIAIYKVDPSSGRFTAMGYASLGGIATASSLAILRTPTATFLFVSTISEGGNLLASYSVNLANGSLTADSTSALGTAPTGVVVDPTNQYVYVANTSNATISAFSTDVNGTLTSLGTSNTGPAPAGTAAVAGTTQNFVYTVNAGDNSISQFTVCAAPLDCGPPGSLVFEATATTQAETLQSIAASPNGQFLYVADINSADILGFTIDPATGNLTPIAGTFPTGTSPTAMAIDPKSQFLYVANSGDNTVSAFTIQANGTLTPIGQAIPLKGNAPNVVVVDPNGQFLYVSDQGSSLQETYGIGPAGALQFASSSAARAGNLSLAVTAPVTVTIGNEYFYATNTNSNTISGASLDVASGNVGAPTSFPSLQNVPSLIVSDPLGQQVFVTDGVATSASLTEFNVIQATGALVNAIPAQGSVPLTALGNTEVVDPSGRFLYVADTNTGQIFLCTLTNGIVGNSCPGATFVTVAVGLAVSPDGQYLFVLGTDDNDNVEVNVFSIDPSSGALSPPPAAGTPYLTGNSSGGVNIGVNEQIAVDPSGKFVVVNNGISSLFTIFSVDGNGGMVKLADQVVQGRPQALLFDAVGSHLYEVEGGTTAVGTYQFDPNSGAIVFSAYAPVNNIPGDAAIDATGQYLVEIAVADDANLTGSVEVFPISATDGTLGAALGTTILGNNTNSITAVAANVTAGSPSVTLIADQLTFPNTQINTSTADMSVTLHNFGTGPLLLGSLLINSGANPGDFTFDANGSTCAPQSIVAAGGTCIISVFFTPTAAGNRSASLTITDNAFPATQVLPLFGTGTNPLPVVVLIPNALAFPTTQLGTSSADMTVTVQNQGGSVLNFQSITIAAGANPGDFALDNSATTCSTDVGVQVGGSCSLAVSFAPTATGARTATLTLADNANPGAQTVALTGTGAGVPPGNFTITPPGNPVVVIPGQPTTIVVTVIPGPSLPPLLFNLPGPMPTGLCVFYPQPNPATLNGPETFVFEVTATPNLSGTAQGQGISMGVPPAPLRAIGLVVLSLLLLVALLGYQKYAGEQTIAGFMSRRWAVLAATSLLLVGTFTFGGCGGSGSNTPLTINTTPPGVYQITIVATAGSVSHSITVPVQVQ